MVLSYTIVNQPQVHTCPLPPDPPLTFMPVWSVFNKGSLYGMWTVIFFCASNSRERKKGARILWIELGLLPALSIHYIETLISNVTVFGDKVCEDLIKAKQGHNLI